MQLQIFQSIDQNWKRIRRKESISLKRMKRASHRFALERAMVQRMTAQDRLERILGPEIIKIPRPNINMLPQPTTPEKQIVAKVAGRSPNYMKGTSSSEARKQSQVVQAGSDKKSQTGKKLDSCSGDEKQSSSSSSRYLKKGLSFKRGSTSKVSRCWDVNAHRETCSSFLKNSKFTEDLMLSSPGVLKVCPYKYCSLNLNLHGQCPPLKSFISPRRRSLKSHASVKMSGDDGCVDIYVDGKKEKGSIQDIDIQEIDFEAENMDMEWGKAVDLESKRAEMVSEGIKSCGSGDENFAILEQSENSSNEQEREERAFLDNSINSLLFEESIIQDDIILGNVLDEKLNSKKTEDSKEVDGEEVEERMKLVSKTEETLLTLAQKPSNGEECNEDMRGVNPREPNYIPITAEPSSETVELKHQGMDERKNAEEWMTDYALQHTVSKLAVERKKNVALLVDAFETILPREPSPAFTYGRHLQACN